MKTLFKINEKLATDTFPVAPLLLSDLRLMNDRRWPWMLLVPRINGAEELHHLSREDQNQIYQEINDVAHALETLTACAKINIGMLGNKVRQLHIHIVARNVADPNWPNPVWSFERPLPYPTLAAKALIEAMRDQMLLTT